MSRIIKTSRSHGFSLIELMIGITLGLLIMTALVTLFVNTSHSNRELSKVNSQIENGRFVMQLLQNEIVHGGFWGGYVPQFDDLTATGAPGDVPSAVPEPCRIYDPTSPWSATDKSNVIGIPIQAYDAMPPGCKQASATATDSYIISTAETAHLKADTDVLLVRHAATCVPGVGNCEADTAGKLYFQYSNCETQISTGPHYVLDASNFTRTKRDCATVAEKRKFISSIYYVRDYAVTAGDGIPTLMRSDFDLSGGTLAHKTAEPLISGIEGLRFELGIDNISDDGYNVITAASPYNYTDAVKWADPNNLVSPQNRGDGSPDTYVRCTTATPCLTSQLANVVSAKIYVLARSEVASPGYIDSKTYCLGTLDTTTTPPSCPADVTLGPFNDNFKRHVFSTTVRLHNVSSRRETP